MKLLSKFPVAERRGNKTYYRGVCKSCRSAYERRWRSKNKLHLKTYKQHYYHKHQKKILNNVKEWQQENREYKLAYQRAWYLANAERLKEKQRKYREENIEAIKAYNEANKTQTKRRMKEWRIKRHDHVIEYGARWRKGNRIHTRQYAREYNKLHPEAKRLSESLRRARKKGNDSRNILVEEIIALYEKQKGMCVYCRKRLGDSYHLDHKTPLSRGGFHLPKNIQLLCPMCNRKKHAKTHDEYLKVLSQSLRR